MSGTQAGVYCTEAADFQDGPRATATDHACQVRCAEGQHTSASPLTVSSQKSDGGDQLVVRLANTGDAEVDVDLVGTRGINDAYDAL